MGKKYIVGIRTRKGEEIIGTRVFNSPSSALRSINSNRGQNTLKKFKAKRVALLSFD